MADPRPTPTVTDAVAVVPVTVLAVVATVSLAYAHLGAHSLPAVGLTSLLVLGLMAYALRGVRLRGDRAGLLAVLGCGLVAAVMFFPGFPYGVGDKDPGNYVAHAVRIADHGSYAFPDPALAHPTLPVVWENDKARVPAMWVDDAETGRIVPQFFHLWPALLATAYDVGGYGAVTGLAPFAGVVAVMALAALLRRLGGVAAAAFGGVLLATNMLEVWQAKYPSTEVFAQALFAGALLAVAIAAQERWRPAAALAGALVGVSFLNRADAWLIVMLTAATLGALWVSRRADGEAVAAAAGLAVVLPYALWQAYDAALRYTVDNGVPGLTKTLALLALVVTGAAAGRAVLARPAAAVTAWAGDPRVQRRVGLAVCAVVLGLLVLGFLRPLLGESYLTFQGRRLRSYDERNLHRLAWFVTLPAFALAGLGVAVVTLRRWRTASLALLLPTLALTVLYAYEARVAARLMWWGRRYVPHVLPGLLALAALALAAAYAWEWRQRRPLRVPAVLAAAALTAVYLGQSLPLRAHHEWQGSLGVADRVSALSGDRRGVYLWQKGGCCSSPSLLWSGPVWLAHDELSVLLPPEPAAIPDYVRQYREAFSGDPVFVVWNGATLPPELTGLGLEKVARITGEMPFWEEDELERPDEARAVRYDFTVYRVP
jgi:hypothetical protein